MSDHHTSLTTVCSIALWAAGIGAAILFAVAGVRGMGVFAILLAGGGGCLTIRRFLIGLADDLIERERTAFQFGIDTERIRSVR